MRAKMSDRHPEGLRVKRITFCTSPNKKTRGRLSAPRVFLLFLWFHLPESGLLSFFVTGFPDRFLSFLSRRIWQPVASAFVTHNQTFIEHPAHGHSHRVLWFPQRLRDLLWRHGVVALQQSKDLLLGLADLVLDGRAGAEPGAGRLGVNQRQLLLLDVASRQVQDRVVVAALAVEYDQRVGRPYQTGAARDLVEGVLRLQLAQVMDD